MLVKYSIDGEDIGYRTSLSSTDEWTAGLWSLVNGKETDKAFRFQKNSVMDCAADAGGKPWTGSIEVCFYHAVENGYIARNDIQSKWVGGGEIGTLIGEQARKGVKSCVGSTLGRVEHHDKKRKVMDYRETSKLNSIKLHYCTAVGLIYTGVLPRPPLWDLHRMHFPRVEEADKNEDDSVEAESSPVVVATTSFHIVERRIETISIIS